MKKVFIRIKRIPWLDWLCNFWTWWWTKEIENDPLTIKIEKGVIIKYYINCPDRKILDYVDVFPNQSLDIIISDSSDFFLDLNEWTLSFKAGERLFEFYRIWIKKIAYLFYKAWSIDYLDYRLWRIENFLSFDSRSFSSDNYNLEISHDWDTYKSLVFEKKSIKDNGWRNPVYKDDVLMTPDKWKLIKSYESIDILKQENILKLLKLRWRVLSWDRFSLLEGSIILEIYFRDIVKNSLSILGVTNRKIKDLDPEMNFNMIINIYLPILLWKDFEKFKKDIENIDIIRKIRNDIVHKNLSNIDIVNWRNWLDSGIALYEYFVFKN